MKLLIDILHPAHVNFFHHFIKEMEKRGHTIVVTAREKDVATNLLDSYHIKYTSLSTLKKGFLNLGLELLHRTKKLNQIVKQEKPDLLLGVMGPSISIVGSLNKIPVLVFYNNETAGLTNSFVYRLCDEYITSTSYEQKVPKHHITYHGYHELAYLHPNYFTPNPNHIKSLGLDPKEKYFLLRFVSWQSSHDVGAKGFADKTAFVEKLSKYGKVVISAEKSLKLPAELEKYVLPIPPHHLSDVVAFAHLYIGESASVASDAACLGVPSIYLANTKRGYTNEQEKLFGLVYNYTNQQEALAKALEFARHSSESIRKEFDPKRQKMLDYCVDVTKWMVEHVEEFGKNKLNLLK
ncbi:DUF354 domain-containing protein [Candidatus Woesearchaeota archaeon]|nr:DUF354 domain-containing protein [Candidatus Woesearchaeota archaeon]